MIFDLALVMVSAVTGQVYAGPGFARRSEHFYDDLERMAVQSPGPELNRLKIDKALHLGTADKLTPQERCLMAALLAHLDIGSTAGGQTAVWPGAKRLCTLLQIGDSTLRRLKGSLEDKGFLVRRFDRRNRPLKDGAIDLKPFLIQVNDLCAEVDKLNSTLAAERAEQASDREAPKTSARPPTNERPTRNTQEDTSEHDVNFEVDEISPELDRARAIWTQTGRAPQSLANPQAAEGLAQELWGQSRGGRLLSWALRRHGPEAYVALAVAATSKTIRRPEAWFGWYATSASSVDLEALVPQPEAAPLQLPDPKNARHQAFVAEVARAIGQGACSSYFSGAVFSDDGRILKLGVARAIAVKRLTTQYQRACNEAAARLGYTEVKFYAVAPSAASASRDA